MKAIILICVFALSFCAPPPVVQFYTESLCPDCLNFEVDQIKAFRNNPNRYDLVSSISFIPFGNASEDITSKPGNRVFKCQHGEKECQGNALQNCAIDRLKETDDQIDYFLCLGQKIIDQTREVVDLDQSTRECITDQSVANSIIACSKSPEGGELTHFAATRTGTHNYVPYALVNGIHNEKDETDIEDDLIGFLCTFTQQTDILPGCKKSVNFNQIAQLKEKKGKCYNEAEKELKFLEK